MAEILFLPVLTFSDGLGRGNQKQKLILGKPESQVSRPVMGWAEAVLPEILEATWSLASLWGGPSSEKENREFGWLLIMTHPTQAEVCLDGSCQSIGKTDLAVRLPSGAHTVRIKFARRWFWKGKVVIEAGKVTQLRVILRKHRVAKRKAAEKSPAPAPEKRC